MPLRHALLLAALLVATSCGAAPRAVPTQPAPGAGPAVGPTPSDPAAAPDPAAASVDASSSADRIGAAGPSASGPGSTADPTTKDADAGAAASTTSAGDATPTGPLAGKLVPARGAYLGLFYGAGSLEATDRAIGAHPRVHLSYFGWADDWPNASSTGQDFAAGRIPLVNWEPVGVAFADVLAGKFDTMIAARADAARHLPGDLFLDFAAEMNEEEGWAGHNPALYIAAWRHIHDIFTAHHATNVVWVWAPNNTDSAGAPPALAYYPGADYVDWTGMDGYNWGTSTPDFTWQPFPAVFGPLYDHLATLGKPILIGETASDEVGGNKATWIADMIPQLKTRFADIKAVVWFDIDKERHWQIDSTPAALAAFTQAAQDPYFNP